MERGQHPIAAMRAMVDLCRAQGIEFKIFAAPMHPITMLSVWRRGARELYRDWLGTLTGIAPVHSYLLLAISNHAHPPRRPPLVRPVGTELDTLADVRPQQPSRYSVRVAPVLDRKGVALFGRDVVRRDRG